MKTFQTESDFDTYMKSYNPKEIWLKGFSEDYPYIIIENYTGGKFIGIYNKQGVILSGNQNDFKWLFKKGMYVTY